ncbi:MAG: hypothetical protein GY821_03215, partial [Gammaproteobacteria bacterium]|nr:hypothetical protein [Gammaproteobacteria bacterium]
LSPQKRREIIAQYEVVNKRIAQRYLGREKLFEAPLPCDNEPFDETVTLSREECSDVLVILVADYMETRRALEELRYKSQLIVWLRIFNAKRVLSFLKRKLFSAAAKLKRRTVSL